MVPGAYVPAYVGLGSNLDEPAAQIRAGLAALARVPRTRLVTSSALYRSPPMGLAEQPDFVNAVAGLLTMLSAHELLAALQAIEDAHGRDRSGPRWGPRTLDLDLLLHGELQLQTDTLTLPHAGLAERAFVLVPLSELAPGLRLPGGAPVARLAAGIDAAGLSRLAP